MTEKRSKAAVSDLPGAQAGYRTRKRHAIRRAIAAGRSPDDWKHYMAAQPDKPKPPQFKEPPPLPPNVQTLAQQRAQRVRRMDEAIRIGLARRAGITPLEFLLSCLRDPNVRFAFKLDAAKAAAPYMHKRMPIAIQTSTEGGRIDLSAAALHRLSATDLNALCALLVKAGVGEPAFIGPDAATYAAISTPRPDGSKEQERSDAQTYEGNVVQPDKDAQSGVLKTAGSHQNGPQDMSGDSAGHHPSYVSDQTSSQDQNVPSCAYASPSAHSQENPAPKGADQKTDPGIVQNLLPNSSQAINTEEALRIAYEHGAISGDGSRPLRLPHTYSPDSMDSRSINDQGTEPDYNLDHIVFADADGTEEEDQDADDTYASAADQEEGGSAAEPDTDSGSGPAGPGAGRRGHGLSGRAGGHKRVRSSRTVGGVATTKRTGKDRDAGTGRKGGKKRK